LIIEVERAGTLLLKVEHGVFRYVLPAMSPEITRVCVVTVRADVDAGYLPRKSRILASSNATIACRSRAAAVMSSETNSLSTDRRGCLYSV
jgi:hypothetical protein